MPREVVSETLRKGLYTRIVGRRILFFQKLGSTMDEAARQAEAGAEEGTVIVAETQSASRGRLGRPWVSEPGNLYVSVIFRPDRRTLPYLSSLCGVAVVRAVKKATGLQARLKWPNDVLLNGKKVAGILLESAINGDRVKYAVAGLGFNVALDFNHLEDLSSFATSLNAAASRDISRHDLLRHLLHQMDSLYLELGQGQTPLEQWKGLLDTLGQRVQATSQGEVYRGLAESVDAIGNLQIRLEDGQLVTLTAGDVTLQDNGGTAASKYIDAEI
jgi:BirA family biotin operon repressor/biotin-[acetyl-CoA-carboxylase] ligase